MSKNQTPIITTGLVFGPILAAFLLFNAGVEAAMHDWLQMGLDVLLAGSAVMYAVLVAREALDRRVREAFENGPELPPELDAVFSGIAGQMADAAKEHQRDHDVLNAILEDMDLTGDTKPTNEQLEKIKEAFHENTDRYIGFQETNDNKLIVEFSATPLYMTPDAATEAVAPVVRKIEVKDGNEPVKRRETPAQQRKRNEKAGKGAFTDDELREQRNAKRRADRAAKKAAALGGTSTTTTTQLPGQTSLVD